MDKQKFILKILLILAITGVLNVALLTAKNQAPEDRFSVNATGRVFAKANVANLTVGFKTKIKSTAAEVAQDSSETMNAIIKELKDLGIEAKDIKTTNYSLKPIYDWAHGEDQHLRGYQANQNVSIKIRQLDKIGQVIAKTTEKGANQIGGVNFTIDDEEELKTQARSIAIIKAKEKAKEIAKTAGIKLGKVVNVYENQVYYPERLNYTKDVAFGGAGGVQPPQIEAGENEVLVEVTVVYEVK